MTVTIDVVDASGRRVDQARDIHDLIDRVPEARSPDSRVLGRVEPYDDLILDGPDIDAFLEDWHRPESRARASAAARR